ncbi:hypothetical protein WA026_006766 [Henosepilachna vigintioctopunctata]|uniref:Mitochondrial assembly of ribosomal large subunit protein 1 n=1 Tax=Henosepilachna vigintioctopunctata TaxID=420089 RepID=A0AAW1UJ20_9CUCU
MNVFRPVLRKTFIFNNCFPNLANKTKIFVRCNTKKISQEINAELPKKIDTKYQIFREDESEVILDSYEESRSTHYGYDLPETEETSVYEGLNLNRGLTGVFDIEDLVDVLKRENGQDILVVEIPKEISYADYICLVSCKSQRHMQAIAQLVRRVYKMKRKKGDVVPKLEGANSSDWLALDLGNIALHIFSTKAREYYDLDSLWSVGSKFDLECNKEDPLVQMLEENTYYLKDLKPAS